MILNTPPRKKKWSKNARAQLRGLTKKKYINLLRKDPNWDELKTRGAEAVFHNRNLPDPFNHVTIHYHPKETYHEWGLLSGLLEIICWTEEELKKKKVIKK